MYLSNYRHHPGLERDFLALKRGKKFWFPHKMKYAAWILVFFVISVSSAVLIIYGMNFGMLKTYLWLTGLISSIIIGILITTPIRILVLCLLESLIRTKTHIFSRKIAESDLYNPENPQRRLEVEKKRLYNKALYEPIPEYKLRHRLEDIKYNIELRNIAVDIFLYATFLFTAVFITFANRSEMTYYSSQSMRNLAIAINYTDSMIQLKDVIHIDLLYKFLNYSLLPSLFVSDDAYSEMSVTKGHIHLEENYYDYEEDDYEMDDDFKEFPFEDYEEYEIKKRHSRHRVKKEITYDFKELIDRHVFDRGWTMEPVLKLMGKPRLRQIRVRKEAAGGHATGFQSKRNADSEEFYYTNQEKRTFTLNWELPPQKGLTPWQAYPWTYRSSWQTKTLPIFGKFNSYPGGGYVADFARNLRDSRIILKYLQSFNWIDTRTRAIFVEFTTYNINTNIFNVVTLIFEKSAVGCIISSYDIQSCRFLTSISETEELHAIIIVLFTILLFFFLFREGIRIHRTSMREYFRRPVAWMDFSIIVMGLVCVSFDFLTKAYVLDLLEELQRSQNNEFISFMYAAFWCECSVYVEALLVLVCSFKVLRILSFRVIFYRMQVTLNRSLRHFLDLVLEVLILLSAFSLFFHLMLVSDSEGFLSFGQSMCTLIGRTIVVEDSFDITVLSSYSIFLAPFFFFLFVMAIPVMFVNIFIAVICLYFREVQKVKLMEKYEIVKYFKYILTEPKADVFLLNNKIHRVVDPKILRMKGGCSIKEMEELKEERLRNNCNLKSVFRLETEPLRLRGGGKKASKEKDEELPREQKVKPKKRVVESEEEMYDKIKLSNFIFERLFESSDSREISLDRLIGMEHLALSLAKQNPLAKKRERVKALACMYLGLTKGRLKYDVDEDKYYMINKPNAKSVIKSSKLRDMKKIVENYGKRKKWLIDEVSLFDEQKMLPEFIYKIQDQTRELNKLT